MRTALLVCLGILFCGQSFAQIEDPTSWRYEVKKKAANEYELIFHLQLKDKWHIWALKPGGDGLEIAPSFTFDKNAGVQLKGKVMEKSKPITAVIDGVDGKVSYFTKQVDYVQLVTVKGNATIKGTHEYQVCSDKICLPPKDKDFVFNIKQ